MALLLHEHLVAYLFTHPDAHTFFWLSSEALFVMIILVTVCACGLDCVMAQVNGIDSTWAGIPSSSSLAHFHHVAERIEAPPQEH